MLSLHLFKPPAYKAFNSADPQNAQSLVRFGNLCSAIEQLPASVVLSTGLAKRGDKSVASGGLANTWRGEYQGVQVAIKELRAYTLRELEEAKKVRIRFP